MIIWQPCNEISILNRNDTLRKWLLEPPYGTSLEKVFEKICWWFTKLDDLATLSRDILIRKTSLRMIWSLIFKRTSNIAPNNLKSLHRQIDKPPTNRQQTIQLLAPIKPNLPVTSLGNDHTCLWEKKKTRPFFPPYQEKKPYSFFLITTLHKRPFVSTTGRDMCVQPEPRGEQSKSIQLLKERKKKSSPFSLVRRWIQVGQFS